MTIQKTKVAIVGMGSVGSTLAYYLVGNQIGNSLTLINRNRDKAVAEALDLKHSMGYSNTKTEIMVGSYEECGDMDIIVLCVAAPYKLGMTRLDMYASACRIMDSIIPPIMASGFNGIFVVVTNPVDLITQYVQEISGLPHNRVIGTGTSLDSSRLRVYLADLLDVDPRSVNAFCMGEHGDSMMVPWSQITIGAKPFSHILEDNPERFKHVVMENIKDDISKVAYKVVEFKGATYYGIASITGQIIRSILFHENKVIPVSCYLNGDYGCKGIYAGIPAVINSKGVKETVIYHLTEEEQQKLNQSFEALRKIKG